jgi:hypothetical protein
MGAGTCALWLGGIFYHTTDAPGLSSQDAGHFEHRFRGKLTGEVSRGGAERDLMQNRELDVGHDQLGEGSGGAQ